MGSKWSNLRGKLAEAPEDGTWKNAVEAVMKHYQGLPMVELTKLYNEQRDEKERLNGLLSETNILIAALERLIVPSLDASGSDIWRGNGYSYSPKPEPVASVEDRQALIAWIKKQKMDDILTVPWQTLNGLMKEEAERGELDIDPETGEAKCRIPGVKVWLRTGITRRKVKE